MILVCDWSNRCQTWNSFVLPFFFFFFIMILLKWNLVGRKKNCQRWQKTGRRGKRNGTVNRWTGSPLTIINWIQIKGRQRGRRGREQKRATGKRKTRVKVAKYKFCPSTSDKKFTKKKKKKRSININSQNIISIVFIFLVTFIWLTI